MVVYSQIVDDVDITDAIDVHPIRVITSPVLIAVILFHSQIYSIFIYGNHFHISQAHTHMHTHQHLHIHLHTHTHTHTHVYQSVQYIYTVSSFLSLHLLQCLWFCLSGCVSVSICLPLYPYFRLCPCL